MSGPGVNSSVAGQREKSVLRLHSGEARAQAQNMATGTNDSQSPLEHFHRTLGLQTKVAVAGWGRKGLERLTDVSCSREMSVR